METESRKLLGEFDGAEVHLHGADVAASCNRIPTLDGHLENVFAEFAEDPSPADLREAMRSFEGAAALPSSPDQLIKVFGEDEPGAPSPASTARTRAGWASSPAACGRRTPA